MARYRDNPYARLIVAYARKHGADPYTLLATAIKESSLDPRAVGDNGTSYGLFQMHVGGAGGSTHQSARRYLDPKTAAENRARHFRGGSGGRFAASVQRPADPAGYAASVDQIIAQLKREGLPGGGRAVSSTGRKGGAVTGGSDAMAMEPTANPLAERQAKALEFLAQRRASRGEPMSPMLQQAISMKAQTAQEQTPLSAPQVPPQRRAQGRTGPANGMSPKGAPPRKKGEADWQYIQRLGRSMFGLQNDPGNSQTIGGRHSAGSEHYDGRAVDFGDARNSRKKLNAAKAWFARMGFDVLDEGDHIHISAPGSGI